MTTVRQLAKLCTTLLIRESGKEPERLVVLIVLRVSNKDYSFDFRARCVAWLPRVPGTKQQVTIGRSGTVFRRNGFLLPFREPALEVTKLLPA